MLFQKNIKYSNFIAILLIATFLFVNTTSLVVSAAKPSYIPSTYTGDNLNNLNTLNKLNLLNNNPTTSSSSLLNGVDFCEEEKLISTTNSNRGQFVTDLIIDILSLALLLAILGLVLYNCYFIYRIQKCWCQICSILKVLECVDIRGLICKLEQSFHDIEDLRKIAYSETS
jgi:predicted PurR-regulated permease PerM